MFLLENGQEQDTAAEVIDEGLDADVDLLAIVVEADDAPRRAAEVGAFVGRVGLADRRVSDGVPQRPPEDRPLHQPLRDVGVDQVAPGNHRLLGPQQGCGG